ncbi:hypothetical protein BU17DRAFT_66244 [Hysterangium stoloniferum]|nr:hypothetical protein BU17DRAFT_66244 [Hysterangium stoloniferum]
MSGDAEDGNRFIKARVVLAIDDLFKSHTECYHKEWHRQRRGYSTLFSSPHYKFCMYSSPDPLRGNSPKKNGHFKLVSAFGIFTSTVGEDYEPSDARRLESFREHPVSDEMSSEGGRTVNINMARQQDADAQTRLNELEEEARAAERSRWQEEGETYRQKRESSKLRHSSDGAVIVTTMYGKFDPDDRRAISSPYLIWGQ